MSQSTNELKEFSLPNFTNLVLIQTVARSEEQPEEVAVLRMDRYVGKKIQATAKIEVFSESETYEATKPEELKEVIEEFRKTPANKRRK